MAENHCFSLIWHKINAKSIPSKKNYLASRPSNYQLSFQHLAQTGKRYLRQTTGKILDCRLNLVEIIQFRSKLYPNTLGKYRGLQLSWFLVLVVFCRVFFNYRG